MATLKLTKPVVQSLATKATRYPTWDTLVPGFGVVVHPTGRKTFVAYYRTADGTQRKPVLGTFGPMTVDQARDGARDMLAKVRAGHDPSLARKTARAASTVAEVCQRYLEEHADVRKKPGSTRKDRSNLRLHVLPRFGTRKIQSLGLEDIQRMHHEMRATPGAANRTLALVSKILNLCERWRLRPEHSNPCRHVEKFPERKIHNSVSELELARLARALRDAETAHDRITAGHPRETDFGVAENPTAIAAIRLLIFTGCRRNEILRLRHDEVNLERHRLELGDSKTGEKTLSLSAAAEAILKTQLGRRVEGNPFVFPGQRIGKPLVGLPRIWYRVRARAGLDAKLRIHDLRHQFGEVAAGSNMSLPMIGRLLGHKVPATTQRYIDFADDPQRAAAELVAEKLAGAMSKETES